jgi:uncharacterized protein YaiL (DUF2058 family)
MKTNTTKYTTETRPDTKATLSTTCDEDKHNKIHNRDKIQRQHWARHMMKTNKTKYTTETRPDTEATLGTTYDEDKQNKIHNRDQIQRQHWAR